LKNFFKALLCVILALSGVSAQSVNEDVILSAFEAAKEGDIKLGSQAVLKLPEEFYFIPKEPAALFMRELGNTVGDEFLGVIVSDNIRGFVSVEFLPTGYIKDDDAKNWDTDELLKTLKDGTEFANKERVNRGFNEVEVLGWIEEPVYESGTHRLIWSASLQDKGSNTPINERGVNYNAYLLGREGYLSLNLVTDMSNVEQSKPFAKELLASTYFNEGKRYEDFNEKTDYIAEFGLAALVGGVAAKKLGLLAAIGVFLLKFWKLLVIAVIAVGVGFRKFVKKDDK
jgi:uncharacterized membrane-anchored protein